MHEIFQDYGSLLMGSLVILGLFISGLVSIEREKARRSSDQLPQVRRQVASRRSAK